MRVHSFNVPHSLVLDGLATDTLCLGLDVRKFREETRRVDWKRTLGPLISVAVGDPCEEA